jgi:urease accessory protein
VTKRNKTSVSFICGALVMILIPAVAGAHGNAGESGFLSGLNHPVFGYDHLIAMVTVGLLSALIGGRAIWAVPAAFVSVMAVGAVLGMNGVRLPFVEYGIALSVLALGSALLVAGKLPVIVAMGFVGGFAMFHGHAHGTEMPSLAEPALYAAGFSLATAALHVFGAAAGYFLLRYDGGVKLLRLTGLLIAASGVYFVAQV